MKNITKIMIAVLMTAGIYASVSLISALAGTGITDGTTSSTEISGSFERPTESETPTEPETTVPDETEPEQSGEKVVITNKLEQEEQVNNETIDLIVEKEWVDYENKYNTRPDSITVQLLMNGAVIEEVEILEADGWTYTFEGLKKYEYDWDSDSLNLIDYEIKEVAVEDYIASYEVEGF